MLFMSPVRLDPTYFNYVLNYTHVTVWLEIWKSRYVYVCVENKFEDCLN